MNSFFRLRALTFLTLLLLLVSCGGRTGQKSLTAGDTLALRHARLLHIALGGDGVTLVTIDNPWHRGTPLHRYMLLPREARTVPADTAEYTVIRVPLRRTVVFSSVHLGLLTELGMERAIIGVTDARYILLKRVRRLVETGQYRDFGMSLHPDAEAIIGAHPDALLVSPFEGSGTYGALGASGLPLIECADYMEPSPLGRAEWMRLYGRLYGCAERADSLFERVEQRYDSIARSVKKGGRRPLVMTDKVESGVWYIPGGESTIGRLLSDAGARFTGSEYRESGSVRVPFEKMLAEARNADFWIIRSGGKYDLTYSSLLSDNAGYALFRPWREHRIFACNTLRVPYFDDSPFHPDRMLSDMVNIFYHRAAKPHMYYFSPLRP